jgi:hypothetical protein
MKTLIHTISTLRTNRFTTVLCSGAAVLLSVHGSAAAQTLPATQLDNQAAVTTQASTADFTLRGYNQGSVVAEGTTDAPAVTAQNTGATLDVGAGNIASLAIPATPYNYYVSPTGNDANTGTTSTKPFRTLARAARAATRAGTTVWVAPGSYAGGIKTTASGTSTARIYWVSTTRYGAKITPPSGSVTKYGWDNRGNYVSIIGFDIDGRTSYSGTRWLLGLYSGGSYVTIQNNHIHHIAQNVPCNGAGGSAIGVDSYYRGIKSDVISNWVHDIGASTCRYIQGIYVSTSGTIKNNVVYRVGEAAIHLWHDATNVIISNNTVATSHTGIIVGGGDFYYTTAGNNNTMVYSNIVYDNTYGISEQGKTGTGNKYYNNLSYKNTSYNFSLKNGLRHYNSVQSEPYFTLYTRTGTPNFKPTAASPVIGRGSASYAHPTDFADRPRNSTTGFDIGAIQH